MDEFKKVLLPLLVLVLVIIGTGFLFQKNKPLTFPAPEIPEIKLDETLVKVKIADTETKRKIGLSQTAALGENEGMLFVFPKKDVQPSFWMKDMQFAIDIIWINDDKVVKIDKNIPPPDPGTPDEKLKLYTSPGPVDYVLEVAAGFSDKNNLKVGSKYEGY